MRNHPARQAVVLRAGTCWPSRGQMSAGLGGRTPCDASPATRRPQACSADARCASGSSHTAFPSGMGKRSPAPLVRPHVWKCADVRHTRHRLEDAPFWTDRSLQHRYSGPAGSALGHAASDHRHLDSFLLGQTHPQLALACGLLRGKFKVFTRKYSFLLR